MKNYATESYCCTCGSAMFLGGDGSASESASDLKSRLVDSWLAAHQGDGHARTDAKTAKAARARLERERARARAKETVA